MGDCMHWNEELEMEGLATGVVRCVLSHDEGTAMVLLNTGVTVELTATHQPTLGDVVIEGELSL